MRDGGHGARGVSVGGRRACSSPIFERSQTCMRRSDDAEPRIVSEKGDHDTWKISSVWPCRGEGWGVRQVGELWGVGRW